MFEFFKSLIDLAGDERRTLSAKASIALLLIIAVIVGEGLFGFAHHYQVEKQLQELKMLNEILPDSVLWRTHEEEIRRLANELLSYKPWTERLLDVNKPWQDDAPVAIGRWHSIHMVTSSGLWLLAGVFAFPLMLFFDRRSTLARRIVNACLVALVAFIWAWLQAWLFGWIPKLGSVWTWNYMVNLVLQALVFLVLQWLGKRGRKTVVGVPQPGTEAGSA